MIESNLLHPPTLQEGCYTFGSGPIAVCLLGSCRIVPYANYFEYFNSENRYTVHVIDVVRFNFGLDGRQVDAGNIVSRFESYPALLSKIKTVRWFVHEHVANYGMFNTDRNQAKTIYDFGMKPEIDVAIPNFNNHFILFQDIVAMDSRVNAQVRSTFGAVTPELQAELKERGLEEVDKFCRCADLTSLPEMSVLFATTWKRVRYFWNINHITKAFTQEVFRLMNDKFLKIALTPRESGLIASTPDMYEQPHTSLTPYDVECYGINWGEPVLPLKV